MTSVDIRVLWRGKEPAEPYRVGIGQSRTDHFWVAEQWDLPCMRRDSHGAFKGKLK